MVLTDIRQQFPILSRMVKGKPLVYFDNAATSQKPQQVIDALTHYYSFYNANIHRGIHTLAEEATMAYEATREAVRDFVGADATEEIIFTKGTTEAINLVAYTWGRQNITAGDEIIISGMEHHSNIVPWQILCEEKKAFLKVIPVTDEGELSIEAYKELLGSKTKLVAVVHVSNSLGTINHVNEIITAAHLVGAKVLIDGAQSAVHLDIDVQKMDCDFFAFSGHKVYGPTGVGVLYGKRELLEDMPVFQGGGEMIKDVTFEQTTYNDLPYKYEAGTPNIADTIALKTALDFITAVGKDKIRVHEANLLAYATAHLKTIPDLSIIGEAKDKAGLVSFVVKGIHPQDIGVLLDNMGIAVRTGHHCTQPLMKRFGIPGTVRASFAMYNQPEEIDVLITGLHKTIKMLT
ncbi:cysteine desulfurase [Pedobacter heparinus]|uniref:Cysteine desulfurase n=1 Tax=Pedobacter heparinus (strain ATCC 13125 / DSM 2366 / CIP 104194 / JCM 7457 / NBRC 12017 / NCIMB 9290 / NRRL B-14731 / HIM 762-3) TaxID=485917 RepID=C6Y2M5_PEDHD|nr:cysteine desulfurase [Pedobacter heparinus]ACU05235.1 cysteine desulfurase, SufS subfamily [Pedobacter heparinus DSM 2366]